MDIDNCEHKDKCKSLGLEKLDKQMDSLLEKELHSLQTLSRAMCHELNNVLGGMLGYSQLALDNPDEVELVKRAFGVIVRGSKRASEFINRLGHFSGFGNKTSKEITDLVAIITDCIDLMKPEFEHSCIKIEQHLDPLPPTKVNPSEIRLLFIELLQNSYDALKKVEQENRAIEITSRLIDDNNAEISLCDTGEGIPEDKFVHIFNPFYSTKDILGGGSDSHARGIGLAIAKRLVEKYEGEIKIDCSNQGKTRVKMTFPVFPELQQALKQIVIVDDEKMILKIYSKFLLNEGYNVIDFDNATGALEYIDKNKVDLIILDQNMPGMSGIEMMQKMKQDEINIPVIVVTAAKTNELARHALELGALSVLSKPINRAKLTFITSKALNVSCDGILSQNKKNMMPSERIMLLDSDLLTREVITIALKRSGYSVTSLDNFNDAVKATEEEYFDLIMIDPFLHDGNGDRAISNMRKKNPYTPIVMLTGVASPNEISKASLAGATHTIEKPLDIEIMLAKVRGILDIFAEHS